MKISVIVPTYKPNYYIWECLESLINQSLNKKKYEVLIILNGEKENYYSNIKNWIERNKVENFKILYTKINGVSNARNIGLDNSKGEYIVFIDDDDYIDRDYLKELLKKNEEIGKHGVVITNYIDFDEITKEKIFTSKYLNSEVSSDICTKRKIFSTVWAKSIPREVIDEIRFNFKFINGEDSLFMMEISKNINKIGVVDKETFYFRRVRENSCHYRKKNIKYVFSNFFKLLKYYFNFFRKKEYNKKFLFMRIIALVKGTFYQLKAIKF